MLSKYVLIGSWSFMKGISLHNDNELGILPSKDTFHDSLVFSKTSFFVSILWSTLQVTLLYLPLGMLYEAQFAISTIAYHFRSYVQCGYSKHLWKFSHSFHSTFHTKRTKWLVICDRCKALIKMPASAHTLPINIQPHKPHKIYYVYEWCN